MLRNSFPPDALLADVIRFVHSESPSLHCILLVQVLLSSITLRDHSPVSLSSFSSPFLLQPFPHREFTEDDSHCSLQSLGLCPSASLVVSKQQQQQSDTTQNIPGTQLKACLHCAMNPDRSGLYLHSHCALIPIDLIRIHLARWI